MEKVYTCVTRGCGRKGPARKMFSLRMPGDPRLESEDQIRVLCKNCAEDARRYGVGRTYRLTNTLSYLEREKVRREGFRRQFLDTVGEKLADKAEEEDSSRDTKKNKKKEKKKGEAAAQLDWQEVLRQVTVTAEQNGGDNSTA